VQIALSARTFLTSKLIDKEVKKTTALPNAGFIRLKAMLAPHGPIPLSKSTIWARVKDKTFPAPVKLSPRVTAWRVEDIQAFITSAGEPSAK